MNQIRDMNSKSSDVSSVVSNSELNLEQKQEHLELLSYQLKVSDYFEKLDREGSDNTSVGMSLIAKMVPPFADSIKEWLDNSLGLANFEAQVRADLVPLVKEIDPRVLAYLTIKICMSNKALHVGLTSVAEVLGSMIEEHARWSHAMKDSSKQQRSYLKKTSDTLSRITQEARRRNLSKRTLKRLELGGHPWDKNARIAIGAHLIHRMAASLVDEIGPLFAVVTKGSGAHKKNFIQPTDRMVEILEHNHELRAGFIGPLWYPMLIPPDDWTDSRSGGYKLIELPVMKRTTNANLDRIDSFPGTRNVYRAINHLQSVPWRINRKLFHVLAEAWDGNSVLGGLPPRNGMDVPGKPTELTGIKKSDMDAHQMLVFKEWKHVAASVHERNHRVISQRVAVMERIALAGALEPVDRFYFVYQMDWRGRVYPVGSYLTPQDDDTGRALLEFAEGKPIGDGWVWLGIHIANMYGHDKVSLSDRLQWTIDNEQFIIDSARNPLDGKRFWAEADKPWCFLAAAIEWLGFRTTGIEYITHLPIHVDGSCNGLQHFAALLRDPIGAELVNLKPNRQPRDVYSAVASRVDSLLSSRDELRELRETLGGVPRKLVKRPIMTTPYGVTQFGMVSQISQELKRMDYGLDCRSESMKLASTIKEAIGELLSSSQQAMDWLQSVANLLVEHDKVIQWQTPLGMPITQEYYQPESRRVQIYIGGVKKYLRLAHPTSVIDKRKQALGVAPNFIHSMDATHLFLTVLHCQKDFSEFSAVHDSYAVLAPNVKQLNIRLRQTFVALYQDDWLRNLWEQLSKQFPEVDIPEPPPLGDFDINEVLESNYFFA